MVWSAIEYHSQFPYCDSHSKLQGLWNNQRYIRAVMGIEVLLLQQISGALFLQDNVHTHVAPNVQELFRTQHVRLLPWLSCSPNMSLPIWLHQSTTCSYCSSVTEYDWISASDGAIWNGAGMLPGILPT